MPTTTIPAKDLRAGHRFKWSLGQRQFRTVKSATAVKAADYPSVLEVDSMIIVLDDCRQVTVPLDQHVWVAAQTDGLLVRTDATPGIDINAACKRASADQRPLVDALNDLASSITE